MNNLFYCLATICILFSLDCSSKEPKLLSYAPLKGIWVVKHDVEAYLTVSSFNGDSGTVTAFDKGRTNYFRFKLIETSENNKWYVLSSLVNKSSHNSGDEKYFSLLTMDNALNQIGLRLFQEPMCDFPKYEKKIKCELVASDIWNENIDSLEISSQAHKDVILIRKK